jgi:UPF0176 protein
MQVLHNRISNEELRARLFAEKEPRVTVSLYKYFTIVNPRAFRDEVYVKFNQLNVFGRIYIAHEGINAQISVPESNFNAFRETLYQLSPELDGLRLNIAIDDDGKSFWVLRCKVPSNTFREQLPMAVEMLKENKDKNIVMYCTGGIRCEKASAYLRYKGFPHVFHVEGGVIEYARKAREQCLPLKFIGKNFVFDERLGERITDDIIAQCHQCGKPCDNHTNCNNDGCHLLFIQCDECKNKYDGCCSDECKEEFHLPEEEQRARRAGRVN